MLKIVGPGTKVFKQQELQKAKPEGLSNFEQKLQLKKPTTVSGNLPPEVTQITPEQRQVIESNLRKRLERGDVQEVLKVDLRQTRTKLDGLARQVTAAPKNPALDAIRNRLNSIEAQYQESGKYINGMNGLESPRDVLQMQIKMYAMTQNIEIIMKFVEQGTSGLKDVLHTQV